ncbi:hypothetical protein ACIQYF_21040 [Pseudomonas sp. NPDC096917]|uniref:hypothetical protein n=1 Tax=Pseudomonas sp. NPDC096917 TaxID=3364483 RepID=UPI00383BA0D6
MLIQREKLLATLHLPPQINILKPPAGFPAFTLDMIWCKERNLYSDFHQLEALIEKIKI